MSMGGQYRGVTRGRSFAGPLLLLVGCAVYGFTLVEPAVEQVAVVVAFAGVGEKRAVTPVLLVPGWLDTGRDLAALRIRFLASGWDDEEVFTLTFREATGSNRDHSHEIEAAIDSLRARTGSSEVDVVAHSMGGLATRWYLLRESGDAVRRVVFIGTPHRGTRSAHLAWGGGRPEMMPDSPFLDTLNTEAPAPSGVHAITIRTVIDTHVVPGGSATLPGVEDFEICCPTHAGMLDDAEVFEIAKDFLEHGARSR